MAVPRDRLVDVRPPERIVRAEVGGPVKYCILEDVDRFIQIRQHYREGKCTVCDCDGVCPYAPRYDWFLRAVRLASTDNGTNWWEPVVLCLTDQALRSLEQQCQIKGILGGLCGVVCRLQRHGNAANGRVVVSEVSRTNSPPTTNTSTRAVLLQRRVAGHSPLYDAKPEPIGRGPVPEPAENDRDSIPPARSRNEKPRVPKGTRG